MLLSIVSPVYQAKNHIHELINRISNTLNNISEYEIILVDDASTDSSWEEIVKYSAENPQVKGIRLSRNFGQHYAIIAGLEHANGNLIVVMDCDLQDIPEEIPALLAKVNEGYDIVFARRVIRQDHYLKKLYSKLFYHLFSFMTGTRQTSEIANFGIFKKEVIRSVLSMKDSIKYFPAMVQWVGFNKTSIEVRHSKREHDKSSYTLGKLFKLAINVIISFSNMPLKITIMLGLSMSCFSFIIGCIYIYRYLSGQIIVLGYSSLIVSLWFLSGLIIFSIGIVGLYTEKIFERTKDRPIYIVKEKLNF